MYQFSSLIAVGALWGCTNPFLNNKSGTAAFYTSIQFWIAYLINQCGSLLYYKLLSGSDLIISVPVCNSLALVFNAIVSYAICKERTTHPYRATCGAILVMLGVMVCVTSR